MLHGRRQRHPTPVLLPGKSRGWRSLVGCSPWGRKESDTSERLHFHFSLSSIGEGNGNPLQCSCLENPRDEETWWAAIYGVAQSRTWLKRLSSSSGSIAIKEFKILKKKKSGASKGKIKKEKDGASSWPPGWPLVSNSAATQHQHSLSIPAVSMVI